jgi:hypothetical protein
MKQNTDRELKEVCFFFSQVLLHWFFGVYSVNNETLSFERFITTTSHNSSTRDSFFVTIWKSLQALSNASAAFEAILRKSYPSIIGRLNFEHQTTAILQCSLAPCTRSRIDRRGRR